MITEINFDEFVNMVAALPPTGRVLGLTATPFRSAVGEDLSRVFPAAAWGPETSAVAAVYAARRLFCSLPSGRLGFSKFSWAMGEKSTIRGALSPLYFSQS